MAMAWGLPPHRGLSPLRAQASQTRQQSRRPKRPLPAGMAHPGAVGDSSEPMDKTPVNAYCAPLPPLCREREKRLRQCQRRHCVRPCSWYCRLALPKTSVL